jgi:hypothetical protein
MLNDIEIMKFPYLGYSPNLIEYFVIIGYEKHLIKSDILPNYFNEGKQTYEPSILNSIASNTDMDMLDNDDIIKLVYPKTPAIILGNLISEPQNSSVIFFLNADTIGAQSKIPFHGYALNFYESFVTNSSKVFIPKAFCIISQYPYYTLFNTICKEILNLFLSKAKNEIPLEVIIYNILNFIPSPMNFSMNLNLFMNRDLNYYSNHNMHSTYGGSNLSNSMNSETMSMSNLRNTSTSSFPRPSANSSGNSSNNLNVVQLTGYPVLDFNLSEIFNLIPMNMVIEILIFNFLEFDMLFFSKNLEILNFTMYIIASLNYPCNDSIYLWHILSVSQEELLTPDTSQFVGKPWAAMMGVNCTYNNTIDSCKVVDSHFIVDLDNKNFFFKFNENNEENVQTTTLLNYIRKILKDYSVPSYFLAKNIKNLLKELEIISKQVIHGHGAHYVQNQNQNSNTSSDNINFFEMNDKIRILNKNIQETFYDFILNILTVFYNNYFLNSTFDKKKVEGQSNSNFFIHYNEDTSNFSKEEAIFYSLLKSSNKYNNYILNFIQEFKCIDLYKIPLIFSEEFIYLKKYGGDKVFKSIFFEIIENFYYEGNSKKPININFNKFYSYYDSELKSYFFDEISRERYQIKATKITALEKTKYIYEYDMIELDNEILLRYIYQLNNLSDEMKEEIFPSLVCKNLNQVKKTTFREIVDIIEKSIIAHKLLKSDNLLIFSLIIMFIITRSSCNFNESISHLRDMLEIVDERLFFLRKYINLILSIYNYSPEDGVMIADPESKNDMSTVLNNFNFEKSISDINFNKDNNCNFTLSYSEGFSPLADNFNLKDYSASNWNTGTSFNAYSQKVKKHVYTNKMCNFIIINFLRNKNILPNEPMMNLFENFTLKAEKEEDDFLIPEYLLEEEMVSTTKDYDKFQLFLQYHYCRHGTKKPDYFIKESETAMYDGDLMFECSTCMTKETKTGIVFKFDFSKNKITSEIFTPLKLYNSCNKLLTDFLEHYQLEKLDRELLCKVIINLIFYAKYMPQTSGKMTYKFLLKFLDFNYNSK